MGLLGKLSAGAALAAAAMSAIETAARSPRTAAVEGLLWMYFMTPSGL
jgi:hypothetical protein